jgi:SAM-dependent methyltransferase
MQLKIVGQLMKRRMHSLKEFEWKNFYNLTKDRPPWPRLVEAVSVLALQRDALDLGCGAGRDTRFLLEQGFMVTAVDSDPHAVALLGEFPQEHLKIVHSSIEAFHFDEYDLVNAHFSLPFMPPEMFHQVFSRIIEALRVQGIFVGQFFGEHDEWNTPGNQMTFLTREQAEEMLIGLTVLEFEEEDIDSHVADGTPKHWHVFHIIAQKGN